MADAILDAWEGSATPIHVLTEAQAAAALEADAFAAALARTAEFKGKAGQLLLVPDTEGGLARVLFGAGESWTALRALPAKLPVGVYRIVETPDALTADQAAPAFALGSYRFDRYQTAGGEGPRLPAQGCDVAEERQVAHASAP